MRNVGLDGKIALITSGSGGIGLATAKRYVNEGASVFITDRGDLAPALAVKEIGRHVTGVGGDVSNRGDLDRLFEQIVQKEGRLDVVFAHARVAKRLGIVRGWVTGGRRKLATDELWRAVAPLRRPGDLPAASLVIQAIDRDPDVREEHCRPRLDRSLSRRRAEDPTPAVRSKPLPSMVKAADGPSRRCAFGRPAVG